MDFATETGPVKPVNGVGQPPMLGFGNDRLFHYLTEAGIPFSRLHDTGGAFGKNVYVDIPNIFRDFDADENDPKNYDFAFTDDLMAKLDKADVRPYFRLGVTIENGAARRAYRIFPPKDYAKWARICEHVMAHYVEGWANGPRVKVSHWEIWNEADFHPQEKLNQMWQGPFEEFIRLYVTAATHLKARFPQEKIGGFGSCGFYHAATGDTRDQAIHHMKCIEAFFAAVKRAHAPLDFFSYHSYAGVEATMKHARVAREYADKYGFAGIELSLNEWLPNPRHEKLGSAQQAAEIAAEMIGFQNGPVDSACIYRHRQLLAALQRAHLQAAQGVLGVRGVQRAAQGGNGRQGDFRRSTRVGGCREGSRRPRRDGRERQRQGDSARARPRWRRAVRLPHRGRRAHVGEHPAPRRASAVLHPPRQPMICRDTGE